MTQRSLVLFDIDATLITTSKAGIKAMQDAGREMASGAFTIEGVQFAGRLDPLIIDDLLEANGLEATPHRQEAMRAGYRKYLEQRLGVAGVARALGGVVDLVNRLAEIDAVTLGLLTGNFPETGRVKLDASGIEASWFAVHVWGCDSPHDPPTRNHLPAVAFERYQDHHGQAIEGGQTCVIGDTPHDVACAKAHGCRSIGVATGSFNARDLENAGADLVVEDLTDTDALVRWLCPQ